MKDLVLKKRYEFRKMSHQAHGQQLTVFYQDMRSQYTVTPLAESMVDLCEGLVSNSLCHQRKNCLAGFDENMQLQMADYLRDCVDGNGIHTTGIKHIDRILWPLYHKIQRELPTLLSIFPTILRVA